MAIELSALKKQRSIIKANLTRMANYCDNENIQIEDAQTHAERAENIFKKYEEVQDQIDNAVNNEHEQSAEIEYRLAVEEIFAKIKATYNRLQRQYNASIQTTQAHRDSEISTAVQALIQHQSSMSMLLERYTNSIRPENTSTPNEVAQQSQRELQLPRVQLPDFDGNLLDWTRFKELFEAFIHNRNNLANVEKLEFLHTKLKGEALLVIKHLKPTNSNYEIAWSLLQNKYNNVEKVKGAYLELLFDQPPMRSHSLSEIKRMYNSINEGFNAMRALDPTVDSWSSVLLFNIEKKIDKTTALLWYRCKKPNEEATFTHFLSFMEKCIMELESMQISHHDTLNTRDNQKRNQSRTFAATVQTCPVCKKQHALYQCEDFKKMNVSQRRLIVQKSNLCFNCLRSNHKASDCKSSLCKKCNKNHNTLLHITVMSQAVNITHTEDNIQDANSDQQSEFITSNNTNPSSIISSNTSHRNHSYCVILPTAIITITDINGSKQQCRALLDSGSQGTLITEACVQRLGLKRKFDKTVIYGIGNANGNYTRGKVDINISGTHNNKQITTEAFCLTQLTQILQSQEISKEILNYFNNLNLADKRFNKSSQIDIILGADVFMDCCLPQKIQHPSGSPIAMNTIFGWVLMGQVRSERNNAIYSNHIKIDLDQQLQRFWEIENIPVHSKMFTPEEEDTEQQFIENTRRHTNGRFIVRLPLKNRVLNIGQSKTNALKRLHAMERKFRHDKQLAENYKAFMREYIELDHMELVNEASCTGQLCFLPHHAVFKPTSTTSKIRVVFDASSKTSNGLSLNDNLLIGPKIQNDIFDMLIKFRFHEVAFTGDIEKMYRQIIMHAHDRTMQCIVWRNNESEDVKTYALKTITYGTSSASYLSTRVLHEIANNSASTHSQAANAIMENFYIDDLLCCSENLQEAVTLKNQLHTILAKAGFHIRKWSSNSTAFLNTVPPEDRAVSFDAEIQQSATVPTLGLLWDTKNDQFKYTLMPLSTSQCTTKRSILSDITRLYDPMGWISPVTVKLKIFMQKLWLKGINWDELLPTELHKQWLELRNDIEDIPKIKIGRWFHYTARDEIELHGFSDASERAYAAAVYIVVKLANKNVFSHLIASKTRIAPTKQISIPRLELCAAHLLVKLISKVRIILKKPDIVMHGWTDSMVVLAWISDHPCKWKTFIANRTAEIIDVMPAHNWHHIKSQSNPADIATRGVHPTTLIDNKLWWHGPNELLLTQLPTHNYHHMPNQPDLETRKIVGTNMVTQQDYNLIDRYSNFTKLVRITALIKRFIFNCKNKEKKMISFITVAEMNEARISLIKISQQKSFSSEIKTLLSGRPLSKNHSLSSVTPFIDKCEVLRVGGRIANSNTNYDQKHPIILHKNQQLTKLIIQHYHIQHLHAGKRLLHYLIHTKYWIPSASSAIKACIYRCAICMRQRAKPYKQQMGNLPRCRLIPAPVFLNVGIDFAGPVQVLAWKGRGSKCYKCWISIFVCMVTKAIHIELVTELSTAAFIAALRRFVARRGKPKHIYTDNGTNFIGANQQLKELYNFLANEVNQSSIYKHLADQEIQWHFSPPAGPHFGGLWEAGVKSIKFHLKRVLKETHLTFEEMHTVLCQVEGCLNSRPLCNKFEGDCDPLTPAHFILLRPLIAMPDEDCNHLKENRLSRWQYVQRLMQQFWKKWSIEYLHQMQQRSKWKQKMNNISTGDIVIIKDEHIAPSKWLTGRIIELHHGTDGLVRVATIKTANGQLKRPIVKLCPLFPDL